MQQQRRQRCLQLVARHGEKVFSSPERVREPLLGAPALGDVLERDEGVLLALQLDEVHVVRDDQRLPRPRDHPALDVAREPDALDLLGEAGPRFRMGCMPSSTLVLPSSSSRE